MILKITADYIRNTLSPGGLPKWLRGKKSTCQCRRCRFNSWVRKIPWRRKWQPTAVFLPGRSHRQRSLAGFEAHGVAKSWTRLSPKTATTPVFLQLISSFVSYLVFTRGVWLPGRQCDIRPIPVLMILPSLFPAALPGPVCECVCAQQRCSGGENMYTRRCQRTSRSRPDSTCSSLHRI